MSEPMTASEPVASERPGSSKPPSEPSTSSAPVVATPPLASRRVQLRPIHEHDAHFIYELMSSPAAGGRVRFGGSTPSPDKVAATLWDSVLAQFIVTRRPSGQQIGLVAITSPDFRNGFAYVSAVGEAQWQGSGLIVEAAFLAFHYAFNTWPFRKIYMEATDDSFQAFKGGAGELFQEEGRLLDHVFWNGRYVDMVIVAVYRETWERLVPRFTRLLMQTSAERTGEPER